MFNYVTHRKGVKDAKGENKETGRYTITRDNWSRYRGPQATWSWAIGISLSGLHDN